MSKEKKQKEIYTSVFKTKLWKKLSLCCMGAATGSVLLLALLFFGSRSIIYRHMENGRDNFLFGHKRYDP